MASSVSMESSIKSSSMPIYKRNFQRFKEFFNQNFKVINFSNNFNTNQKIDFGFVKFVDHLVETGEVTGTKNVAAAQAAFSALLFAFPQLKGFLPLSARALVGIEKIRPSKEGQPLLIGVVGAAVAQNYQTALDRECGLIALLSVDALLRIGEWDRLKTGEVADDGVEVALILPDSKTGPGGIVVHSELVRKLLKSHVKQKIQAFFFV